MDGAWLHTDIIGPEGPAHEPIVLLHGLGVSAASLGPLAERLARRHEVVSCDLPGFGASPAQQIWGTRRSAEGVRRVLDDRGLARAVLAGHSYGCHVAACLAAHHPERVGALILLSPAFDRRFGSPLAQLLRLTADATMERPSLVAGGLRDYLRAGPRRVVVTLREACRLPLEDLVAVARCPVLIVRGSRDALTTGRWAEELRRSAAAPARVAVVPRAAHALGHEAPGAVAGAIEAFLEQLRAHPTSMARDASRAG